MPIAPDTGIPNRWTTAGRVLGKAVIGLFLLSVAVVEKRDIAWPALSWPMFSTRTTQYPGGTYQADLLCAVDTSGEILWIRASDLWGIARYQIGSEMITGALDTRSPRCQAHRKTAIDLIRYVHPELDVDRIEIWRLTWDIDLNARMPLNFDKPRESVLLASYSPDGISHTPMTPDSQP